MNLRPFWTISITGNGDRCLPHATLTRSAATVRLCLHWSTGLISFLSPHDTISMKFGNARSERFPLSFHRWTLSAWSSLLSTTMSVSGSRERTSHCAPARTPSPLRKRRESDPLPRESWGDVERNYSWLSTTRGSLGLPPRANNLRRILSGRSSGHMVLRREYFVPISSHRGTHPT